MAALRKQDFEDLLGADPAEIPRPERAPRILDRERPEQPDHRSLRRFGASVHGSVAGRHGRVGPSAEGSRGGRSTSRVSPTSPRVMVEYLEVAVEPASRQSCPPGRRVRMLISRRCGRACYGELPGLRLVDETVTRGLA